MPKQTHTRILHLPRKYKRLIMLVGDAIMMPLALWSAFALRLGSASFNPLDYGWLFLVAPLVAIPAFVRLGLYRAVVRYIGGQAAFAVLKGVTITTVALMIVALMLRIEMTPRSVFLIFWLIAVLYVGGSRFFVRAYFHWLIKSISERELVAIYGAGDAGMQLASALQGGNDYLPVAFVDDNQAIRGSVINGIQVYASDELETVIENLKITQIMLAMPSISAAERRRILNRLESLSVYVRTVPAMPDLLSGKVGLDQVRDVDIEDLLGRESVPPDPELMGSCVKSKVVMVTGAAGSIGSELCRQILLAKPKKLLLFEIFEYGLYRIENELRALLEERRIEVEIVPLLGSIRHKPLLEKVLTQFKVDVIFHAAAYKHVPLVEHNIIAGVRNNVFGTLSVAKAAIQAKVKTFVLISTDKAVRPTNVMGATKRLAELIVRGLAADTQHTKFCVVRFGNVLGSSGSVVPLFREQVRAGGPVTVTHPEVRRYFMTIPEAAQLVIQAGAMVEHGDVFVLDMGELVRVDELAHKMIHLMGYQVKDEQHPNGEIVVEYTGLRPGEKLYEELLLGNNLLGTWHSKILRAEEEDIPWSEIEPMFSALHEACDAFDYVKIRQILLDSSVGFAPQHEFVDVIYSNAEKTAGAVREKVSRLFPN